MHHVQIKNVQILFRACTYFRFMIRILSCMALWCEYLTHCTYTENTFARSQQKFARVYVEANFGRLEQSVSSSSSLSHHKLMWRWMARFHSSSLSDHHVSPMTFLT